MQRPRSLTPTGQCLAEGLIRAGLLAEEGRDSQLCRSRRDFHSTLMPDHESSRLILGGTFELDAESSTADAATDQQIIGAHKGVFDSTR